MCNCYNKNVLCIKCILLITMQYFNGVMFILDSYKSKITLSLGLNVKILMNVLLQTLVTVIAIATIPLVASAVNVSQVLAEMDFLALVSCIY